MDVPALTSSHKADKRVWLTAAFALPILAAIFFLWSLVFSPIFVTLPEELESTKILTVAREITPSTLVDASSQMPGSEIVIRRVTPGNIEFALPVVDGVRLRRDQLLSLEGCWKSTFEGERIESCDDQSPAIIRIQAKPGMIELPFLAKPGGATIAVEDGSARKEFSLDGASYDWAPASLPLASRTIGVAAISPIELLLDARLAPQPSDQTTVIWRFGHLSNVEAAGISNTGHVEVDALQLLRAVTYGVGRLLFVVGGALMLLAIMWLVGVASVGPGDFLVRTVLGLTAAALLINSTAYIVSLDSLGVVILLFFAVTVCIGFYRLRRMATTPQRWSSIHSVILASLVGMFLTFWPVLFTPTDAFLGLLQTDTFYYTNVSTLIQRNAILDLIRDGSFIGHGMRSIDLAVAAAMQSATGFTSGTSWLLLVVACTLLVPALAFGIGETVTAKQSAGKLAAWVVALSATQSALFFEAYFAQFLLTAGLYGVVFTGVKVLTGSTRPETTTLLAFFMACTLVTLLYPYFSVPAAVMVGLILLNRLIGAGALPAGKLALAGVGVGLLSGNIGYYFLAAPDVASQFKDSLNALALNIVFPFINESKFFHFLGGVAPFHGNFTIFENLSTSTTSPFTRIASLVNTIPWIGFLRTTTLASISVAFFSMLLIATTHRKWTWGLASLNLILAGYALLAVLALALSGPYAYAKLLWTGSTFLPIVISCNVASTFSIPRKPFSLTSMIYLVIGVWVALNVSSRLSGPAYWAAGESAVLATVSNISVSDEIALVADALAKEGVHGKRVALVPVDAGIMTDPPQRLSILAAHAMSLVESAGGICTNCQRSVQLGDSRWLHPISASDVTDVDAVILLGRTSDACGHSQSATGGEDVSVVFKNGASLPEECLLDVAKGISP